MNARIRQHAKPCLPTSLFLVLGLLLVVPGSRAQEVEWRVIDPGQGPFPVPGVVTGATELSGLTWLGDLRYAAVSDDGGRLFPLTVDVDRDSGRIRSAVLDHSIVLPRGLDLEGVAYRPDSGTLWVSDDLGPAIREYRPDGTLLRDLELPSPFSAARWNLGLESLAWDDEERVLWTANEESLTPDGERSGFEFGTVVRLQRFASELRPIGQWAHVTGEIPGDIPPLGRDIESSGVSDLVALRGSLLALERAFGARGFRSRLVQLDWSAATDVTDWPELAAGGFVPARAVSLWEEWFPDHNFEGAALGPMLSDGSRSLLLVSDDGHGTRQSLYPLRLAAVDCGNGSVEPGEQCDDGDRLPGDGCSGDCRVERCGDGIVNNAGEECDDGNDVGGDGCSPECRIERSVWLCREKLARVGREYAERRMRSLQDCRNALNEGRELWQDRRRTVAVRDPTDCSREHRADRRISGAGERARRLLADEAGGRCMGEWLPLLDLCATASDELIARSGRGGCFLDEHDAAVDAMIEDEFGILLDDSEHEEARRCQEAIAEAGLAYADGRLTALQKCRNQLTRGRSLFADRERREPIMEASDCPRERWTASTLERLGNRLRHDIERACRDEALATIRTACARTVEALVSPDADSGCLVDGHDRAVDRMLAAQYGG